MPGRVLFEHRRSLWAAVWGVSLLAFFHVLVNPQSGYLVDTALVPVATTYALFALFTLASVILWAWFRNRDRQVSDAGSGPEPGRGSE
jgi:predicted cobalt transporter CbtA